MTDIWVLLIREPDWDSDRYLPGGEGAADAAEDFAEHGRFEQAITDAGARVVTAWALQNRRHGGTVTPGPDATWGDPVTDGERVLTGLYALECDEQTARRLAEVTPTSGIVELRKAFPTG